MARVSAIAYRETIWSELYAGNQHTVRCLKPAVLAAETALELAPEQRKRTVLRLDGGAGSDDNLQWLLARGYHIVAKGASHRRADALARRCSRRDAYTDCWLGEVTPPIDYGCPVRVFVKRRLKNDTFRHSYYISALSLPSKGLFMARYNHRGAAEVEQFRNDKTGLNIATRRKHSFNGQLGYILLTDLAHNMLAHFHHHALRRSRFESYGLKCIVRDLLAMPGRLVFDSGRLQRIELLSLMKNAEYLLPCLEKYCLDE